MAETPREDPDLSAGPFLKIAAAYLVYSGKLELFRRNLLRDGKPGWRILRYQHVLRPQEHPLPLGRASFVTPAVFEQHLSYLSKNCLVRPLGEIVQKLENGESIPERTVVLTFDGGYRDFYTSAFPLLKRFQFPATVFLPTAFIGSENAFWYDKLLIGMLMMREAGYSFPKLSVLDDRFYNKLDSLDGRKVITLTNIAELIDTLRKATPQDRLVVLTVIGRVIEDLGGMPAFKFFLDWKQIQELSKQGIELGSIGHNHIVYSELNEDEIASDLRESLLVFQEFGVPHLQVTAYPEGVITKEARSALYSLKIRFSVGQGQFALPNVRQGDLKAMTHILGRTNMFEEATSTKSLFACRLWDAEAFGYRF